jgi:phosphoglycerol transferase MdoB-like AlkP superfamily enzyme
MLKIINSPWGRFWSVMIILSLINIFLPGVALLYISVPIVLTISGYMLAENQLYIEFYSKGEVKDIHYYCIIVWVSFVCLATFAVLLRWSIGLNPQGTLGDITLKAHTYLRWTTIFYVVMSLIYDTLASRDRSKHEHNKDEMFG